MSTLKSNARRSVLLERWDDDGRERTLVVKRFHHPGLFYRLRDRGRAHAEFELLRALHAAGVRVPRPRGVRPAERGWQVEMDWIPGAVSWRELLERPVGAPPPAPAFAPERLAGALGRLLARLHELGLDHADLHPGNVLLAPDGEPWAIDFHKSRLRAALGRDDLRRDLVGLAAGVRERVAAPFRARALLAWSRALPARLRSLLPADRELAREVEELARERRRAEVRKSERRWTRVSASCRVVELDGGGRAYLARALPAAFAQRLASGGEARDLGPDDVHLLRGTAAELLPRWFTAVRLADHGVPALRPLCLIEGRASLAAFDRAGSRPRSAASTPVRAEELGRLLGALHDRGLRAAVGADDLFEHANGRLSFGPSLALEDFDPRPSGRSAGHARFASLAPPLARATDAPAFRRAYVAELRGGRAERERLAAELEP